MIVVRDIVKQFDNRQLFNGLNLTIEKGEFVICSGPSGCGKTTLLNMIGALEPFDGGEILVDDIDISNPKQQQIYFRYKVGFLFQNFALIDHKTVKDNLQLIRSDCRENISIEEALARVGLADKLNKKVFTLSGGEQQRVALARLMLKKSELILADEPTGSLDRNNADKVIQILRELNQEGKTIIMVTHDDKIKEQGGRIIEL